MNYKPFFLLLICVLLVPMSIAAKPIQQTTDTVLMVEPNDFAYNAQTAKSNTFQNQSSHTNVQSAAMDEFDKMVKTLSHQGITVITMPSRHDVKTPDAVFPNNWFSLHHNGKEDTVIIYSMLTPNRRAEVRVSELLKQLKRSGHPVHQVIDLRDKPSLGVLEGTGSLVFDRAHRKVYASISPRTSPKAVKYLADLLGYQPVMFHSYDKNNKLIYHTNVMMSVGKDFSAVCLECIRSNDEREALVQSLKKSGKTIISLSQEQINLMTGNILELKTHGGAAVIVMSQTAYQHFTKEQREQLEKLAKLVPVNIETIEKIGGGSARCMLAEVF